MLSIGLERSLYVQEKQTCKEETEPSRQVPTKSSFDRLRQSLGVDRCHRCGPLGGCSGPRVCGRTWQTNRKGVTLNANQSSRSQQHVQRAAGDAD